MSIARTKALGGYPRADFAKELAPLLNDLADREDELPIRLINVRERERLVEYDTAFQDVENKKKHVSEVLSGKITGNCFHPAIIERAVGGTQGALYRFATQQCGSGNYGITSPGRVTHGHIDACYRNLCQEVRKNLQDHQVKQIQQGPYPDDIKEYVKTLGTEAGKPGMSLKAEIKETKHHRQPTQSRGKAGAEGKGYNQVQPSEGIKKLMCAFGQGREEPGKIICTCPNMAVPTKQAVANLSCAIAAAVYTEEKKIKEAAKRIEKGATEANAVGGVGLYATKSRNENAKQIVAAVTIEARKSEGINVVISKAEEHRQVGKRCKEGCLVVEMTAERWPRIIGMAYAKVYPESVALDQFDIDEVRFGDEEQKEGVRRELYRKGLMKPYLKRSKSANQHGTTAADMLYAIMGRPVNLKTPDMRPLAKAVAAAVKEKVGDRDYQIEIESKQGHWLAGLLETVRDTVVQKFGGKGGKDCIKFIVNKAIRISSVEAYHRDEERWHSFPLSPAKGYGRIEGGRREDMMEFGREFSNQEHIESAYFIMGNHCTSRYAYVGAESGKGKGDEEESQSEDREEVEQKKDIVKARNAFQYYLPLHQFTPSMKDVTEEYDNRDDEI